MNSIDSDTHKHGLRDSYPVKKIAYKPTPFLAENVIFLNGPGIQGLGRMARCSSSWNKFIVDHFLKDIYRRYVDPVKELKDIFNFLGVVISSDPYGAPISDCNTILTNLCHMEKAEYRFLALIRYIILNNAILCKVLPHHKLNEQNACFLLINKKIYHENSDEGKNVLLLRKIIQWPVNRQAFLAALYDSGFFEASINQKVTLLNYLVLLLNLPADCDATINLLECVLDVLFTYKAKNVPTEIHPYVIRLVSKQFLAIQ